MPPRAGQGGGRGGQARGGSARGGPPRGGPDRGGPARGGPARGGPARGGPARGGTRGGSSTRGGARGGASGGPLIAGHVESIGVKRPSYGASGTAIAVSTNHFRTTIPQATIHHYDVVIGRAGEDKDQVFPASLNFEIVKLLQEEVAPNVFTPRAVYDGRKNMFASTKLALGETDAAEFIIPRPSVGQPRQARPGRKELKDYRVKLKHVASINPEVLSRFLEGKQSHDNTVLTAITALNVTVRMEPSLKYPFNVRSFFTSAEKKDIGHGIELWRGYFQSVRPALGQMLVNIDISTGAMYKPGGLLNLCMEVVGRQGTPDILATSKGLPDRERIRIQRFIQNVKVVINYGISAPSMGPPRIVKKLTKAGAAQIRFEVTDANGNVVGKPSVAEYFQKIINRPLRWPDIVCAELGNGAIVPIELCTVTPGQIIRKQVPPEKTKDVLDFSTKKPHDRFNSIRNGLGVLQYGQSDYVRSFGMVVEQEPLSINARVLAAPTLVYGLDEQKRRQTITPRDGAWNMINKKMYDPTREIVEWVVIVYETSRRFGQQQVDDMVEGLRSAAHAVGISMPKGPAIVKWESGQGRITEQLRAVGAACRQKTNAIPNLVVVILPEGGNDIYTAVKYFGDVQMGVVTQCMKSTKCFRAKAQYFANVCLKINAKFGGKNMIPDPRSVGILTDPANPTVVIGADVIHPAPGSDGRPSFTALVGNVDSDSAKYIATMQVQTSREEIIEDLKSMMQYVLTMYMGYRDRVEKKPDSAPKRIIFYRDGVSEGQFKHVLEREVPLIKEACKELKINPKITMIIVGKRHHVRFFPKNPKDADRSGNCPAGTVVDTEVTNPVEFDFYLQSHGGLLGTSRPAHYNVLHDENGFTADGLQSLTFALCHCYARSTRSVSIPAPVYYADIVCSRAKHHYDPQTDLEFTQSETATNTDEAKKVTERSLEAFRQGFRPLHENMRRRMYFC